MEKADTPIHQSVREAIEQASALTTLDIRNLRNRSTEAIFRYKVVFWSAIGLFNLILWVPLPFPKPVLIVAAVISLLFAFIVPVVGIRKHNRLIDLLQDSSGTPKKGRLSENGRKYMEQVRAEARSLVKAEAEILEESRFGESANI